MERGLDSVASRWEGSRSNLGLARISRGPPLEEEAPVRVLRVDREAEDAPIKIRVGSVDLETLLGVCNLLARDRADNRATEDVVVSIVRDGLFICRRVDAAAYSFVFASTSSVGAEPPNFRWSIQCELDSAVGGRWRGVPEAGPEAAKNAYD